MSLQSNPTYQRNISDLASPKIALISHGSIAYAPAEVPTFAGAVANYI